MSKLHEAKHHVSVTVDMDENVRSNLYIHPRYTKEQILLAEPSINADYMKIMNTNK